MTQSNITQMAPVTPKADKIGVTIKLKVFWKTTKFWTDANIVDYQKNVPNIAEQLRNTEYWNKDGDIEDNRFTCEDFAIRVLCQYASTKGLPVKLTTGVRRYGNMEIYNAQTHNRYGSNMQGFTEMVMLTYGARDMQRVGRNTISVANPEELLAGDILAQALDAEGAALAIKNLQSVNVAHHIQLVYKNEGDQIHIFQGNSGSSIHWYASPFYKALGKNTANPQDSAYGGKQVERGIYLKSNAIWNYANMDTGAKYDNKLKEFMLFRWDFKGFNK